MLQQLWSHSQPRPGYGARSWLLRRACTLTQGPLCLHHIDVRSRTRRTAGRSDCSDSVLVDKAECRYGMLPNMGYRYMCVMGIVLLTADRAYQDAYRCAVGGLHAPC